MLSNIERVECNCTKTISAWRCENYVKYMSAGLSMPACSFILLYGTVVDKSYSAVTQSVLFGQNKSSCSMWWRPYLRHTMRKVPVIFEVSVILCDYLTGSRSGYVEIDD